MDDDEGVTSLLRRALESEGYRVSTACSGAEAIRLAKREPFNAIILDVVLGDIDGFEVCSRLRASGVWTPILLMTGRKDTVEDRVAGLDAGADDFIAKPFVLAELSARLRALSRRQVQPRPAQLQVGDLVLDPATHEVTRRGERIDLSSREFALLHLFMSRPGEVLSREAVLDWIWDANYSGTSNIVDVYVGYLRQKIDRPFGVTSIETVRGTGYRLCCSEADDEQVG